MSLSLGGNNFGGGDTHQVPEYSDWEFRDSVQQWFAVNGESIVPDVPHGRTISIEADFFYDTQVAADQGVDAYAKLVNRLSGTLAITIGGQTNNLQNVQYKGLRRRGLTFYDAAGDQWIAPVVLIFRQLKP